MALQARPVTIARNRRTMRIMAGRAGHGVAAAEACALPEVLHLIGDVIVLRASRAQRAEMVLQPIAGPEGSGFVKAMEGVAVALTADVELAIPRESRRDDQPMSLRFARMLPMEGDMLGSRPVALFTRHAPDHPLATIFVFGPENMLNPSRVALEASRRRGARHAPRVAPVR